MILNEKSFERVRRFSSVLKWGARGREFESRRPDQEIQGSVAKLATDPFVFLGFGARSGARSVPARRRLWRLAVSDALTLSDVPRPRLGDAAIGQQSRVDWGLPGQDHVSATQFLDATFTNNTDAALDVLFDAGVTAAAGLNAVPE